MNQQSPDHATTTVQVKEIGLPEQAPLGSVIAGAAALAAAAAGAVLLSNRKKKVEPATQAESARAYLQHALDQARTSDLARNAEKQARKAEKQARTNAGKASSEVRKATDRTAQDARSALAEFGSKLGKTAATAQGEGRSLLDTLKASGADVEKLLEGEIRTWLKDVAEQAGIVAEQGKSKTAGFAQKAQNDVIPQAKEAVRTVAETSKEKAAEMAEHARTDVLPAVKQQSAEIGSQLGTQAKQSSERLSAEAATAFADFSHVADEKRKEAVEAAQRGGRETRSLLVWSAAAGLLVYGVLLDEEQQRKVKQVATDVLHEVKNMYTDLT